MTKLRRIPFAPFCSCVYARRLFAFTNHRSTATLYSRVDHQLDGNAAVERPPRVLKLVCLFFSSSASSSSSSSSSNRLVIWTTVSNEELHIYNSGPLYPNEGKRKKEMEHGCTLISSKVTGCVR
jgi:hypothetical protein